MYAIDKYKVLIFDTNYICELRENKHLCGHLIGCLANNSRQNTYYGAPLLLSNEEAKLLMDYLNAANLYRDTFVRYDEIMNGDLNDLIKNYDSYLENFYNEQNKNCKEKRLVELESLKVKIIEGKRKSLLNKIEKLKQQPDFSNEALEKLHKDLNEINSENDIGKAIKDLQKCDMQMEIFLQTPKFLHHENHKPDLYNETFLKITSSINYKYIIFRYLWSKGYYLTCGAKFGGDYLVYLGDPLIYHSKYILLCLNFNEFSKIKIKQLIHYGRMSSNVKKTFLLACVHKDSEEILFTCINWSHL